MSLSASTKLLLEHAKADGPSAAAREAMWTGVQTSTVASAVVTAKGLGGVLSSKLLAGIALGASLAAGVATTVFVVARPASLTATASNVETRPARELREIAPPADMPRLPMVIHGHASVGPTDESASKTANVADNRASAVAAPMPAAPVLSEQDRLAREARVVSEARGALRRGEPELALRLVRAERHKRGARLVPEELNVEIQALRAMGDEVGARHAEGDLAGKYPEQSLAH